MSDHGADRDDLEAERTFLLRSLDDLENELEAGNIDPDTYRVLHDDYTARASAVIQSIADGVERPTPASPRVPPALRMLTLGGIIVFAVVAAVLLAHAVGQRRPGGQITGDAQSSGSPTTASAADVVAAAKTAAAAQPKSYDARLRYARALVSAGALPAAVQEYIAASKLDPTQAEPIAYEGWITALVARKVTGPTQQELFDAAAGSLDRAKCRDAAPDNAFAVRPGRAKTAIGTVRKISCHRFQYGNCARLSPPISQTKRARGKRRRRDLSVSAV